jgi:hypothetical protein
MWKGRNKLQDLIPNEPKPKFLDLAHQANYWSRMVKDRTWTMTYGYFHDLRRVLVQVHEK